MQNYLASTLSVIPPASSLLLARYNKYDHVMVVLGAYFYSLGIINYDHIMEECLVHIVLLLYGVMYSKPALMYTVVWCKTVLEITDAF